MRFLWGTAQIIGLVLEAVEVVCLRTEGDHCIAGCNPEMADQKPTGAVSHARAQHRAKHPCTASRTTIAPGLFLRSQIFFC